MNNDQLITKFNPANVGTLTEEDLTIFRNLTTEEIGVLAKAYPNTPIRRPYLVLYDNNIKPEKQLYALSTYQNLYNVRKFSNMKNIVPFNFKNAVFPLRDRQKIQSRPITGKKGAIPPGKKIVVDLSANEAAAELQEAVGGPKKTSTPVVNIAANKKSGNPAQDAIDKATAKKPATKKVVTEKTEAVKKTRGKIQVDLGQAGAAEPGAE